MKRQARCSDRIATELVCAGANSSATHEHAQDGLVDASSLPELHSTTAIAAALPASFGFEAWMAGSAHDLMVPASRSEHR
jgi:hypothetical protein